MSNNTCRVDVALFMAEAIENDELGHEASARNAIKIAAAPRHTRATAAAVYPANNSDRAAWLTATTPG